MQDRGAPPLVRVSGPASRCQPLLLLRQLTVQPLQERAQRDRNRTADHPACSLYVGKTEVYIVISI